ncbi:unnamed protein product [Closterium sp. NIES-64]|nr:unnamed protein product [Closterium sp. NIES-64]
MLANVCALLCSLTPVTAAEIDMSDNKFWGPIGESIGTLTNLEFMSVAWSPYPDAATAINGSIPSSIGNLLNLRYLSVAFNKMNSDLPDFLSELTALTDMAFRSNALTGSIPTSFGTLSNLQRMELSYNQLNGSVPVSLANLHNLTEL